MYLLNFKRIPAMGATMIDSRKGPNKTTNMKTMEKIAFLGLHWTDPDYLIPVVFPKVFSGCLLFSSLFASFWHTFNAIAFFSKIFCPTIPPITFGHVSTNSDTWILFCSWLFVGLSVHFQSTSNGFFLGHVLLCLQSFRHCNSLFFLIRPWFCDSPNLLQHSELLFRALWLHRNRNLCNMGLFPAAAA